MRLVIVHGQNRYMFLHRQPALYTVEMLRKDGPERLIISLAALCTLPLQHDGLGSQDFRHRPLHKDDLIRMLGGKILEQALIPPSLPCLQLDASRSYPAASV